MRTIKLMKDHESPEGKFKAGETIEVDVETWNWLMSVYMKERQELVQKLDSVPSFLKETKDDR